MARIRLIKPGFFLNDELAEIDPLGRLLFAGLWTIADREGRLEDRAKRIKIEVLPYDDCDVDGLLDDLHNRGFITRYTVNGNRYIQIVNFQKHQNPHVNEKPSEIPPFTGAELCGNDTSTIQVQCKNSTSTVQALEENHSNRADTDPYTDTDTYNIKSPASKRGDDSRTKKDNVPYDEILDHFTKLCPSLPKPAVLSDKRKKAVKARWQEIGSDMEKLDSILSSVEASDFLSGRTDKFRATIDWVFKAENFLKIREGNYANRKAKPSLEDLGYNFYHGPAIGLNGL